MMIPNSRNSRVMSTIALSAVAAAVGSCYVDAKLAISTDVKQMLQDRAFTKRLNNRISSLGDEATLYHMLLQADAKADALWFEGITWTYAELKTEVNRLASFLYSRGVREGQFVAVFMTNSPEMIFTIYAISQLGAVPAMINTSLRSDTLLHCINIAEPSMLIATTDLIEFTTEMSAELQLSCVSLDLGSIHSPSLPQTSTLIERVTRQMLLEFSGTPPRPKRTIKDVGALIYTSGTSGKPKAVAVKAFLFCLTSTPLSIDLSNPKRYFPVRTYSCLPLFHATAFLNGLCYSVGTSGCFCLSKKFSASKFSQDLVESRATRMQYVGELCRYLVATPPSKYDKVHSCIVGNGNGLQKDIWNRFKERFNIHEIREIYRSTEGIAKFDNFNSGPAGAGKVGFFGPLRRKLEKGTYLVKYDTEKEDLYRHPKTGFCVLAELDEPGEAIGRIQSWELYPEYHKNPKATELKLVRNVFDTGDLFQRTGDLLVHDREGWIRFHDRTGDTFRWKGENVSAGEVRAFISEMPNVHDVSVYGVKLDSYDGQAGAAGITLIQADPKAETEFITKLPDFLKARGLPNYAIPRLIRITGQIDVGVSFKHAKDVLKKRSWHPEQNSESDSMYWLDGETYKPIDLQAWSSIASAKARL